jgi:hypothetical protein
MLSISFLQASDIFYSQGLSRPGLGKAMNGFVLVLSLLPLQYKHLPARAPEDPLSVVGDSLKPSECWQD